MIARSFLRPPAMWIGPLNVSATGFLALTTLGFASPIGWVLRGRQNRRKPEKAQPQGAPSSPQIQGLSLTIAPSLARDTVLAFPVVTAVL